MLSRDPQSRMYLRPYAGRATTRKSSFRLQDLDDFRFVLYQTMIRYQMHVGETEIHLYRLLNYNHTTDC
jgi:hypothetical protein